MRSRQPRVDWIQGCSLKPPAYQFYPDDFLGGTIHFTDAEVGLYKRLLCVQWSAGSLPDDDAELQSYGKGNTPVARVKLKFEKGEDGRLRNARMEQERRKQAEFRDKQKINGSKGGRPHTKGLGYSGLTQTKAKKSSPSPSPSPSPISDPDPKVPVLAHFERFWSAYPRKVGKQKALSAFVRHKCSTFIERILSAIEAQKGGWDWQKDGGQFIPYPERWLNGGHWDNAVSTPPVNGKPNSDDRAIKDMERLLHDQDHLQL